MSKKATAQLPDEAYEQMQDELALIRAETIFLRNAINLLNERTYEADYIVHGPQFLTGYTMAIKDLVSSTFNKPLESYLNEDTDEPDWTPWEGKPF